MNSSAARAERPRRTCLAVPGSSPRFIAKARGLPVDEVFLDLEDAVAPARKADARAAVAQALREGDWGDHDPGGPGQRRHHRLGATGT